MSGGGMSEVVNRQRHVLIYTELRSDSVLELLPPTGSSTSSADSFIFAIKVICLFFDMYLFLEVF